MGERWGLEHGGEVGPVGLVGGDPRREDGGEDGEGQNYSRLKDDVVDKALDEAGATVDQAKRKAAYERAVKQVVASRAHIFLYNRLDVEGARKHVKGHTYHPWLTVAWDIEKWWLDK